eukprot:5395316-Karenia_brevis.AAC.1
MTVYGAGRTDAAFSTGPAVRALVGPMFLFSTESVLMRNVTVCMSETRASVQYPGRSAMG